MLANSTDGLTRRGAACTRKPMAIRRAVILVALASLLCVAGSGCAPLNASTAISEAESAQEQAKSSGAHKNAPYEYFMARAYLVKAKRADGYSEFNIAQVYGSRARELFIKSVMQARENLMRLKVLQKRTKRQGGK